MQPWHWQRVRADYYNDENQIKEKVMEENNQKVVSKSCSTEHYTGKYHHVPTERGDENSEEHSEDIDEKANYTEGFEERTGGTNKHTN